MRFLRWYWELTKKAFATKRPVKSEEKLRFWQEIKQEISQVPGDFWRKLKWSFVTVFCAAIIAATVNFLWGFLPEPARDSVTGAFVNFWTLVKPFFIWLGSFDWHGGMNKAIRTMLRIAIGLFAVMPVVAVFMIVAEFIKFIITGKMFKENGPVSSVLGLASFIPAVFVGYYVATSSYADIFINWFLR